MFPAIIGTLFATFILLAGISILVTRYFFWKTKVDQSHNLSALNTEFNFLNHSYNPSRYYRFQNIRFIRW
ncbi:MAG: hypothetical protein HOB32_08700 [Nitrospina sp.]|nr:hypothetical protein [Nitrospina sp.]